MIASDLVLVHYDENLLLKLYCDASFRGLGVVISHMYPNGSERPLSFASRSLSKAEKNYSQIDREALSIVWAINKFHMFLFARLFTLVTDCKVLLSIFIPVKGIPSTTASRLQRWAIFLSGYNYTIEYRKTSEHGNADGLSRLPLPNTGKSFEKVCDLGYVTLFDHFPVTFKQIAKETVKDKSKVIEFTKDGWPSKVEQELSNYFARRNEISVVQNCLIWNNRVIIPECFEETMIKELYSVHPGVVKMKSLARSYILLGWLRSRH